MKKSNFITLLSRELTGELNREERQQLESLKNDEFFNVERMGFRESWDLAEVYRNNADIDVNAAFNKFSRKYSIAPVSDSSDGVENVLHSLFLKFSVAVAIILLGFFAFNSLNSDHVALKNNSDKISQLELSESVSVSLAPDSKLEKQDNSFSNLNGSAHFYTEAGSDVVLNVSDYLLSNNGQLSSFEVNKSESKTIAKVLQGSLIVKGADKEIKLMPGNVFEIDNKTKEYTLIDKASSVINLVEGTLSFNKTPLDVVFKDLETFFGTSINVESVIPEDCHFTAQNIKTQDVKDVFAILHTSFNMGVDKKGLKNYRVYNISCK